MVELHAELIATLDALISSKSTSKWSEAEYLNLISKAVAMLMVLFLEIHPYANGNGHISRFLVWFSLIKLGRPPKRWSLHTRPPYDTEIRLYREGFPEDLEIFILKAIRKK
jgi:Fic family protein